LLDLRVERVHVQVEQGEAEAAPALEGGRAGRGLLGRGPGRLELFSAGCGRKGGGRAQEADGQERDHEDRGALPGREVDGFQGRSPSLASRAGGQGSITISLYSKRRGLPNQFSLDQIWEGARGRVVRGARGGLGGGLTAWVGRVARPLPGREREFGVYWIATFLINAGWGLTMPLLSVHLFETGMNLAAVGVIQALAGLAAFLSQGVLGTLSDRRATRRRYLILATGATVPVFLVLPHLRDGLS